MKKTLLIYALIVALLIATISLAVSANVGKLDSNGKVMGDPTPFINDQNRITEIKEEMIKKEEYLKAHPSTIIDDLNEVSVFSNEEAEALHEKAEAAKETAKLMRELFENGLKIVNHYSDVKYSETIDDLRIIDRDMLEVMVDVIESNKLSTDELAVLKNCLVEKYFIVLKTDPLCNRINKILDIK